MNAVLEEIYRTRIVRPPKSDEQIALNSSISADKGEFLAAIVRELGCEVTVETGLAYGVSAMWICEALREIGGRRHIAIDPCQAHWRWIGVHNVRLAGYGEMFEFHDAPAHIALPKLEERGEQVDFAFIDGCHSFDYALVDFFLIDRILRVGGVVAVDDTNFPSVQKVCRYVLTNRRYSIHRCFADRSEPWFTRTERAVYHAGRRYANIRRFLKPETAVPNMDLGMAPGSTCIAFRKEADDCREWDFHREF